MTKTAKATHDTGWGDFTLASDELRFRIIFRSFGADKTGKDHFGLTGPGPIAIQSFDVGLEGVVEKFVKAGKEVRRTEYEFDKNDFSQKAAQDIVDRFETDYAIALKKARTIMWDTESEFWEVCRYAEFGQKSDRPNSYERLNGWYRDLIQQAYDSNVNLQLIQKTKEKWGNRTKQSKDGRTVQEGYPTGEFEPYGFKELNYIVQANLQHFWVPGTDESSSHFEVKVLNCRQNMGVAGETFEGLDLPTLGQLVFPDSTEKDWA